jgi:glucose/mannose transport system permease protein
MTNGGPGQSTWVPAYFVINALSQKQNLGYASAAASMMLIITALVFLPLVLLTAWQARRRATA